MAVNRYPILLWRDAHGVVTACSVQHFISATGATRTAALDQLHSYYEWMLKTRPWQVPADIIESALTHIKVPVRPEYRDALQRVYTAESVTLTVPCVHGKLDSGMHFASVPPLGVWLNFTPDEKLRDVVCHYVQQALRERTPEAVLRYLPPDGIELHDINVATPHETARANKFHLAALPAVAEPIAARDFRTGLSHPFGREAELGRLVTLLSREKQSLLIVGGPGSGKTALLAEAARRAERAAGPPEEKPDDPPAETTRGLPRFWMTSGARLIAGMKYLGQWEERVENVIAELQAISGVLCAEHLLGLLRAAGRDPSQSIAAFLVPYLQRGELRLIAETTPEELDACRRLLPAIVDCCQLVRLDPMNRDQALFALERTAAARTQNSKILPVPTVVPLVYRLFARFMPYEQFPGTAAAFTGSLFDVAARDQRKTIADADVLGAFIRRTGLPPWLLRDDQPLHRSAVLDQFQSQIIGQDSACAAVADVVTTFKAGLNDPTRPLAALLFAGPTGVGKTELAKTLARYLFGHGDREDPLVRLDMSEYATPGAGERLLATPAGEPSPWITRVRQQPFCVVLLDEIEKAAPEVFDVLLGVLDEGRLTDPFGRLTSFRSAILILASNIGAAKSEPFGLARTAPAYASEVEAFFRPEFFNRLDCVVTFSALTLESMRRIVAKELSDLAKREGFAKRKVALTWSPAVIDWLCRIGFDKRYGARPLQRTIEQHVVSPLARYLLASRRRAAAIALDVGSQGLLLTPR